MSKFRLLFGGKTESGWSDGVFEWPRLCRVLPAMLTSLTTLPETVGTDLPRLSAANRLAAMLDGRQILQGSTRWDLTVYGVFRGRGRRWVQVGLDGPTRYLATVELSAGQSARHALHSLSEWLCRPDESRAVLNVA
jgi:hypothetical protein